MGTWRLLFSSGHRATLRAACLLLAACSGGGGGSPQSAEPEPEPIDGSVVLSWDRPLSNEDGSALDFATVAEYRVYWARHPGACDDPEEVFPVFREDKGFELIELPRGVHYFRVTTVLHDGTESACSGEASKVIGGD